MRILLLGGTVFLGRALTDAALAAGHDVTHANRGASGADPRVETITVDREATPFTLGDDARTWDAVVDTCGYLPPVVRRSAEALEGRAGLYAFVSSISVYRDFSRGGFDEDSPRLPPPDPMPEAMTPEHYGALKAACEDAVTTIFGDRALVVRPGLIVGPHDRSDRFTWWPWRVARGGRFVAPGRPERRIQFVDVRDLADWMVARLGRHATGTYHVTGPGSPLTMGELVEACLRAGEVPAEPCWLPDEFLLAKDVPPWMAMPLWLPESDASHAGFLAADVGRALANGLAFRPLDETVRDTLAWARSRPAGHAWKAGLPREREDALLADWRAAG